MASRSVRLIFHIFTLLALCSPTVAAEITGKIVRIVDGDTVVLLAANHHQEKIRLAGIDAPERKQPFGRKSKKHLSDLVAGEKMLIEFYKKDRWGRVVGKILQDGHDINLEQIKSGLAWHFKKYQHELSENDRESYNDAEIYARKGKLGLWIDPSPIPPWEFRRNQRK